MIEAEFGDGSRFGARIEYSYDGPHLLGTGGALKRALPLLRQKFFVLYGDSYLPVDYRKLGNAFLASEKPALMTVFKNEGRWDTSNVWFDGSAFCLMTRKNACHRCSISTTVSESCARQRLVDGRKMKHSIWRMSITGLLLRNNLPVTRLPSDSTKSVLRKVWRNLILFFAINRHFARHELFRTTSARNFPNCFSAGSGSLREGR